MKTNFKRIGKQSISIVLAVMMMLSTMLVGTVTSNAVEIKAGTDFYLDIRNATEYFNNPNTIYMSVVGAENADYASNAEAVGSNAYKPLLDKWYPMTRIDNSNIYKVTVKKDSSIGKVSFWNQNAENANNVWEKSCSLGAIYDGKNNKFTLNNEFTHCDNGNINIYSGTWSTYESTEPTDPTDPTKPTDPTTPAGDIVVYFANPVNNGWTDVYNYIWKENTEEKYTAGWPGNKLTDILQSDYSYNSNAYNVYKVTIPKAYNSIIFNNNAGQQTGDLKISNKTLVNGNLYIYNANATDKVTVVKDYQPPVANHSVKLAADSSANATVTVNNSELPVEVAENATYSLTVTPNENYYIKKITVGGEVKFNKTDDNYADSTNAITISDLTMGTADVEVKVEAAAAPVPVTLHVTPVEEGGAAYISSYTNETGDVVTDTTGDNNLQTVNAKPNTSVTFKAKEVNGYFPMWNVDGKKSTGATFTLDASSVTGTTGVTVYLTYEKIENHNLTITSGEGGSVSYTYDETTDTVATGTTSPAISVASNQTIKLTANADSTDSYVFKGWEFDSNAISYVSGDSVSASITISVVGDVKVIATFEKNSDVLTTCKFNMSTVDNALANDTKGSTATSYKVYKQTDGAYTVTLPASEFTSSGNYYVSFSTDGTSNTLMPGRDSSVKGTVDSSFTNYAKFVNIQEISKIWYYPSFSFQNREDIKSVKFIYNPNTKTYTVTGTYYTAPSDAHTVYATKGNTHSAGMQYGTTTISMFGDGKIYKTRDNGSYNEYVVGDGNQITVECKVTDAQAKLGYYVYAFVVNGAKVDVIDTGNNVYQTTAPITVSSDLEITPVYYNKQIEADGNYVTIYTNAPKELQDSWGNSISIYSWYDNGGAEMNGYYPGQLMMRDSQGKFGAKVPKYSYYEDENGKYVPNKTQKVLGITNNNYSENQVVHTKFLKTPETQKNHQTYDYDDFEKLTGLGYDTVQFDIKYFPTATDSNQHLLVGIATDQPSKPNFINKTATPYENLTNIDGKPVSILGYTNDNAKANNNVGLITGDPLQIISVGNQSVKIGDETTNVWSTIWYVYDSKGNYITQGLPSDFIPRGKFVNNKFDESEIQTDAYKAIKDNHLEYNSAVISYEKEMDASISAKTDNTGWRVDGRWYYARSTDKVDVNVGIIYRNSENDVWTVDRASADSAITGMVTGGSASFDYTDSRGASHTNLASASVERNTIITLNATNGTQYKFIGWGTPKYDADGKVIDYNLTDLNATYTVSTNTKLFAMYEPYATGSVTITHSKYTGPDSHNGLGIFSVTARVLDANGKPVDSQAVATQSDAGSVTLENIVNKNDGSYIEVTLNTQSYAKSHFLYFYYPSVSNGVYTLEKDPKGNYYDKECPANARATKTFTVKVSDLFDSDGKTQKVMALNYYSDLKLPEVASNITFNYNPYSTAPNPSPKAGKGTGKTTFTLTITDKGGKAVYTSAENISSLTLKANDNIKSIVEDYLTTGNDYTITITMNPDADNHCTAGQSYYQQNDSGTYTYQNVNNTFDIMLSKLYDKVNNKFNTNTVNLYTDFTAKEFNYNVTFKYLGYESREYYNKYGFTQDEIPEGNIQNNWRKTYTASGTFYGADIDKYYNSVTKRFNDSFLLKVAPYEDNFVQSITWDLDNAVYSESSELSVTATVLAKYKNDSVTVTADLGDGSEIKNYSVNYASLVKTENLINKSTESNENSESKYLIVAPDENADGQKFSYWTIQTDNSDGIVVAKCYSREFNFIAYDNYLITACYGKDVVDSKSGLSATMQFLEYSRNKYDNNKDRVYADFAVAYNYDHLLLQESNNPNIVCGVAFVLNSSHKSDGNAVDTTFTVDKEALYKKVKELNDNPTAGKKLTDGSIVFNYEIDKKNLDNKNRIEYNWSVDNRPANQQLTLLAYSYIYDKSTEAYYSVSDPQAFKFYEVGNKSYETQE